MARFFWMGALLGLLCVVGCSGGTAARDWQDYKSEKGKFSAQFPFPVGVEEGPDATHFHAGDDVDFRIAYSKVAPQEGTSAALQELRRVRDGTAESLGATVKEAKNIEVQGLPAIEFILAYSMEGSRFESHNRYVQCKNRFYQQIVTVPAGTNAEQDIRKFFESLKIETE